MTTTRVVRFGEGGADSSKPNGNIIDEREIDSTDVDNRHAIFDAARQALAGNRTYIASASPTAAQTTAQVKALSRQNNGLIRLLLGLLDGTD